MDSKQLAAAVVVDDGLVLVVRRSKTERFLPNVWGVPCGKLDPGETPAAAVLRELEEETGILGEVVRLAGTSDFDSDYQGRPVRNHQSNFLVRPLTTEVRLPHEDQRALWVKPEELDSVPVDAYNRTVIMQVIDSGSGDQQL
ncbi:NUDIX domain-containing protein [Streptomyces beijiangensis]|uniref:NUDIX domain-containing protein n=1 Tax=Streptomyces beijiangensis TaxID=163361 RepID=A0A939JLZ4_9ACTN|nr:NUDIX domain-containing protein [Streptomyces beijiangensis]